MAPAQIGLITEIALDAHGYHGGVGRALVEALRTWFKTQGVEQSRRLDAALRCGGAGVLAVAGRGRVGGVLWLK